MITASDPGSLWWDTIAGPRDFINKLKSAFFDGCSVLAEITSAFPYRWTFRDGVSHWIGQEEDIMVEEIDCGHDYKGGDIGEFLVNKLAPRMTVEYMRRRQPGFLKTQRVLDGKLIWVRGIPPRQLKDWIQFAASYHSDSMNGGLFLIEAINVSGAELRHANGLRHIVYPDLVKTDDVRLFASILADEYLKDEPTEVKQYAVELATTLCWKDGEVAEELLGALDIRRRSPVESLKGIFQEKGDECVRGKGIKEHPYEQLRKGKTLERQLWVAQLRTAYPLIELQRLDIIQRWYDEIREALESQYIDGQYGTPQEFTDYENNPIRDPFELELGMLDALLHKRQYDRDSQYMLYLPNHEERVYIRFLKDCRNSLAHLETCAPDVFYHLISGTYPPEEDN